MNFVNSFFFLLIKLVNNLKWFSVSDGLIYVESFFVVFGNFEIFCWGSWMVSEWSRGGWWRDLSGYVWVRYSRYDGILNVVIGGVKNGVVKKMLLKDVCVCEY